MNVENENEVTVDPMVAAEERLAAREAAREAEEDSAVDNSGEVESVNETPEANTTEEDVEQFQETMTESVPAPGYRKCFTAAPDVCDSKADELAAAGIGHQRIAPSKLLHN